ncbi:MAG: TIR domain-containing protein [Steroidobacteraceae bacterium]
MSESTKAIFLSYASQDADAARRIGDALREAGLEVWFDQSELRGGDAWDEMIRHQIAECALFVPIISAATAARLEGYFRLEWTLADQRTQRMARTKTFIVPVCVDATLESGSDVPESFIRVQWSRLPAGATQPAFIERVRSLLNADKARASTAAPIISPIPPPVPSPQAGRAAPPASRSTRRLLIGAAVAVLALVVLAWLRPWSPTMRSVAPASSPANMPSAATAAVTIPEKSIAVLPFVDMSEKKDQEYFSDGLSEELLDLLAQVPDLRVAARTSSFFFKGKAEDVAAIGLKLRVAHVLEGSVRKAGGTIRVTAQLIRADNGYHIWSKTYDRDIKDIFKVQDEISGAVVDALKVQLLSSRPRANRHQTDSTEAYSQYLMGNQLRLQDTPESNERARAAYQKAIALDPTYAAAYSGIADAEWRLADMRTNNPDDYARASAAAEKAIALAPDAPEGYWARGQLRYAYYYDWSGAQTDFQKALSLDPTFGPAGVDNAQLLAALGKVPDAIDALRRIIARDPMSATAWHRLSRLLMDSGRFTEVPESIERIRAIGGDSDANLFSGDYALIQGRWQQALEDFRSQKYDVWRLLGAALAEHSLGHPHESRQALEEAIRKYGDSLSYQYAMVNAWCNDSDAAFHWLDRAYQVHDGGLIYLKHDMFIAGLRADPRYAALLKKLGLPR